MVNVGYRPDQIAFLVLSHASVSVGIGVIWVELNCLVIISNCRHQITLFEFFPPPVNIYLREFRIQFDGSIVVGNGSFRVIFIFCFHLPALAKCFYAFRVYLYCLGEVGNCAIKTAFLFLFNASVIIGFHILRIDGDSLRKISYGFIWIALVSFR